ncbi:MAG: carboxypeptidase regulatory-like domain-containing protein [Candidatus Korobacteraceae bacterium]|jgi:outer membrane receptor protein involved in Fe transport
MTLKRLMTGTLAFMMVALLMTPSLGAQSMISGDLAGTVTDPSGAVVPGAIVTLKNNANGEKHTTTSNSRGAYRFSLLSPGSYVVSATAQGFSKAETTAQVNVGLATVVDVKLAVGSSSQTVEVTSAAPLVQTDNAELSTNFNQTMVDNMPNGGNDLTYIAQTAPGINMNTGMGYGNFQTAGLPATSNVFTLNGENQMDPYLNLNNSGATNLMLGKNAVQEATVITNAYGGQYGQQAGAQISYVTKSGTNAFHGNAQYWWTGSSIQANSYFAGMNTPVTPTPFTNNNQWAASIGGPIKKDKLFFFLDYEGISYIVPSTQQVQYPTVAFADATLANLAVVSPASIPLYSKAFSLYQSSPSYAAANTPLSGGGCEGAVIPGVANCFMQGTASPALPATENQGIARIDYNLGNKDHMFWSVTFDAGVQATYADPVNSAFSAASYQPSEDGQGQWTHTFGSNATNQFVYAGSYYRAIFNQIDAAATFPTQLDLSGIGYTPLANGEYGYPQGRNVTQYQLVDDFSVTKGAHNLKFGANFRRYDVTDYAFSQNTSPLSYIASTVSPSGVQIPGVENFYNGLAAEFAQSFPNRDSYPVALWGLGVYAQDEWRVTKNLKLTFAMRVEHDSNPVCQLNCGSLFTGPFSTISAATTTPYNQMIDANLHQIFRPVDAIDWAPRFGFAWSPGGSEKTVLRGGFGLFYDAFPAVLGDSFMTNIPTVIPVTQFSSPGQPNGVYWADQTTAGVSPWLIGSATNSQLRAGFPASASYASLSATNPAFASPSFNNMTGNTHIPRYQEWSLQLEQELDSKSSVSVAYIGNHGIHGPVTNYPNAYAGFGGIPGTAPNPLNFATVTEIYSGAVSNDNQLTASYQRRLTYGFTVQASYTWAHALDEISNGGILPYNATTSSEYQLNPYTLANNYGNADYDIRSSFNATYVWQTPWKFGNKFANGAFGGWTLSQNFFARSGLPLQVFDANTFVGNYNPISPYLPAQVVGPGQGACNQYLTSCLNSAGFASAGTVTTFPNQVRNVYRGPGFFDSDISLNKSFKITERVAFTAGANFYNVFNHPNFAQPGNLLGTTTFGQVTEQTAPPTGPFGSFFPGSPAGRIIQMQGKIVF